ncbi:sterol regulatory element-binding protein cleavage-activating protein [Asbolus verrucosus]|uniref:Sterol regulatory element-binding protein cleavage-activating protein n=1 Tax=Asbolus verrucosus TaxID=1661398 RepID=A0A482W2R1_ASBVE|nr:sterol regulatory element-binding protein cleavage-activating protein [Asbolus verrucosus]
MSARGDEPRQRGAFCGKSSTLQEKVAQFYYAHGLFCSTYPATLVFVAICVTLLSCYPLLNLPLPGNAPLQTWTSGMNSNASAQPFCYIQQVVLKAAVLPWGPELHLGDAFRAPLYEAFKLLDIVRNYQDEASSKTLGHVCLHVEAIRRNKAAYGSVLPQYSCLVLSPANLWQQDVIQFAQDSSLLTTIFNHHNFQKGKTSITEMLFGMKVFDTGIKRYPLRNRYRIIQYAVTLFLKEYDQKFVSGLRLKLQSIYPLHQSLENQTDKTPVTANDTLIIQYPGEINFVEFIPISLAFLLLFLYFYFSFRKIELIHSKFGMAFSSVITVCGSLTMTYGLCFFFGLTLNLEGKVVFPYLVLLVGLENVLCLTKSVVSSPLHLDVKIRIAQGLSKEGWSITKNLLLEITILTFGIFTFVAVIQEFCIFAVVGLVTDYFMQMVFFSTVLGIDIRRRENLVEKNNPSFRSSLYQSQAFYDKSLGKGGMRRSKSHPRLSTFPANIVAGQAHGAQEKKIPKRLKLVNIWTRTRFFHRAFMILMVVWICNIAYNSGIIEHYILNNNYFHNKLDEQNNTDLEQNYSTIKLFPLLNTNTSFMNKVSYVTHSPIDIKYQHNQSNDFENLKHSDYAPWLKLSPQHWFSIVRKYNLSLSGQYIAILPNIKISHVIRPEQAALLRNPSEKYGEKFQWQALAAALDPIDFQGMETATSKTTIPQSEQPFYPTSVFAMILITILCLISVIVLAYTFVVLYRCICSRNYAEWRASWFNEKAEENVEEQVMLEAVPVVLDGHQQEIEWITTDGATLVSSSLDGQLKVWDSSTGELLTNVDRKSHFHGTPNPQDINSECDDNSSDYESGSPPSRDEHSLFPRLKHRINTNFSNVKDHPHSNSYDAKADFNKAYRELYFNRDIPKVRNRMKEVKRTKENTRFSFSESNQNFSGSNGSEFVVNNKLSPIWCMDYLDNLIVIGCADGRLEFWEATTGRLKCIFEDGTDVGISSLKIVGSRIVASRLYGTLELFQLQTYNHGRPIDWNFSCAYRRTHVRTGSAGSVPDHTNLITQDENADEDFRCLKVNSLKAHQQPIICLDCEGGRILTGSQDHTLKVFRLDDGSPQYTLHGHCGPITCLFIDRVSPATSGSGSQDGMLCVWDLLTGACMYNIQAHDGSITSLTYSASYVISLGSDDRLCVWERFQGHLLNTIYVSQTFSSQVLMLAPHLVLTARNGGLVIWDVRSGECVRTIALGRSPFVFIKQLILLRDAVLCDYGNQLRIVRFPLITHKFD